MAPSNSPSPTLVLLHGASLNHRMWDAVRLHLESRFAVVAPDLPGHGVRLGERYTVEGAVHCILECVERTPGRIVLVGDSLGAYSALAAARQLSAPRLAGLVLSGCTFDFTGAAYFAALARGTLMSALAGVFGEERLIRRLMPKALGPQGFNLAPGHARALLDAGMSVYAFRQAVLAVRAGDWRKALAAIDAPKVIANGLEDKPCMSQEQSFLAVAHGYTGVHFACKHGASLWLPREFATMLNEFAARLDG